MKTGIELIKEERERQINEEGHKFKHDDELDDQSIALAASVYAIPSKFRTVAIQERLWRWHWKWWKPTPNDRIRELQKAGALIAAEIDRLQRLESKE